jgi:peptide/nickel transport system substrate-binding protein
MGPRRGFALLLILAVASACASSASAPRAGQREGARPAADSPAPPQRTLVVASRNEPPTLASKPLRFVAAPRGIGVALFNGTLDYLDHKGNTHPFLVQAVPQLNTESWKVFPDGRMETSYTLKPNLVWHDGTPASAADAVFAWQAYKTPDLGLSSGEPMVYMEEVLAPDDRTLIIRWNSLYPLAATLKEDFQQLPRHLLEQAFLQIDSEAFTNLPYWTREFIGLGPYRLERWEPGAFYEAVAFDRFVFGKPKIEQVQVRFMNDPNTVLANMLAGEIHASVDFAMRYEQGATLKREWTSRPAREGSVLIASPSLFWKTSFQFRPEIAAPRAILDPRVRRAMAHLFDKEGINEALMGGLSVITQTVVSPRAEYYPDVDRVISKYPFNPTQAQQRLEEAGFVRGADGFYVGPDGIAFNPDLRVTADPTQEAENAILIDTFRRAGIAATSYIIPAAQQSDGQVRSLFPSMASNGGSGGETDLRDFRTASSSGPENRWSGRNRGAWSSAEYDRVWESFNRTLDRRERIAQIVEMERLLNEEVPIIPHYFTPQVMPHVAALKGPIAREVPDSGLESFNIWQWEWQF